MKVEVRGPVGRLEGFLEEPEGDPRGVSVVCHPHPMHGGTMENTVVFRTARALRANGFITLRFNFRGVGASEGKHDGEAEQDDVDACLGYLRARYQDLPAWAAGYSFGARTVCGLANRDDRIERVVLVALPLQVYDCVCLERLTQPGLLVLGSQDEFGTRAGLEAKFPGLPESLEVFEIEGADHFFRGRTPLLEERIRDYAERALEETV